MTTTPIPAPEPMQLKSRHLWPIIEEAQRLKAADRYPDESQATPNWVVFSLLDDIKTLERDRATQAATIASLEARVAELERELSDVSVWGQACDDVCAELRQQLEAQAGWETVENGSYWVYVNKEGSRVYKKRDEYPNTEGYFTVSGKLDFDWLSVSLPDNWRLQRRKAGGDE